MTGPTLRTIYRDAPEGRRVWTGPSGSVTNLAQSAHRWRTVLPPLGNTQTRNDSVARLLTASLEVNRPPWTFTLIVSDDGGSVFFGRIHDCIGDGVFAVTNDVTRYTRAGIFSQIGKQTDCLLRFSTQEDMN